MNPKKHLSQDEVSNLSIEEIHERIAAEQEFMNKQKHKKFFVATHGSKTKNGGLIRATINQKIKAQGHLLAVVGDEAIYEDGTTSKIISGAGEAGSIEGYDIALVGSRLENGDEIIESLQSVFEYRLYADREIPQGFLSHD
ncbi:PAAR domain-containing protein [Acinetobacter sp. C32I]|uniref:PAAR domain-containing protein n=1 Tax=Acinetobacter sp. C32I TaxID=2950074 RepID=UPI002036B9A5|nr:PAAR domain-containing protein [Acinetobacter sp. C32I]USA52334.1 PAAR domain-containing protein [Acinetobacter sp. C32I]